MLEEAIAGFNAAKNKYASGSGSVVRRTSDALDGLSSSFGSLNSMCESAKRNIRTRMERAKRDRKAAEERRRRLEAICSRLGIRPPARHNSDGGSASRLGGGASGAAAGSGGGSAFPNSQRAGQFPGHGAASTSQAQGTGMKMTPEDRKAADEFAEAFAALGDIVAELKRSDETLGDIEKLESLTKSMAQTMSRLRGNVSKPDIDTGRLESLRHDAEQLSSDYRGIASDCAGRKASIDYGDFGGKLDNLRELRGEIEQAKKTCPGKSVMVEELLNRVNAALGALEDIEGRLKPLHDRMEAVEKQCEKACRQLNETIEASQRKLVSEQTRSGEIAKDVSRLTTLVDDASELLSRLSGKPSATFRVKGQIGKLPIPELGHVADISAIIDRAKKVHRDRLQSLGAIFRRSQRHPDELGASDINATRAIPRHIVCGDATTTALDGGTLRIPIASEFPFQAPLLFADAGEIPTFLLRLIYAMPIGGVRITAIDCSRHGESVLPLNALGRDAGILEVVANANDFAPSMDSIVEEMGSMSHDRFSATVQNWAQFNAANPGSPLPLHIIAVFSVDAIDSYSRAIGSLANILKTGAGFGILCLVAKSALDEMDERQRKMLDCTRMMDMPLTLSGAGLTAYPKLNLRTVGMAKVSDEFIGNRVADYLNAFAKRNERPVRKFNDLFENVDFWKGNSAPGLSATIGWDSAGNPVAFELGMGRGKAAYHALVGGTTGSGKSALLHTLIQSLAGKYSPEELQFYLIDYKNGDEFKKYADDRGNAWLPHIRMIARHRDPRFALEFFDFLSREFQRRSDLFGTDISDIESYRKRGGKMPRILVVIDEFQMMFDSYHGQDLSVVIAERLPPLFKQGRSYGIHLVLATQDLRSTNFKGRGGILAQIAARIALYGQKEDGILADNNDAATRIAPQRQCIVNMAFGAKDSPGILNNIVADVPFSKPDEVEDCKKFRALVVKTSREMRLASVCRVFDGTSLPPPPPSDVVNEALKPEKWNVLFPALLGARTDFASTPFSVSFTASSREHLLVAGEDGPLVAGEEKNPITGEAIWDGIRDGLIRSFRPLRSCEVLWYDPTAPALPNGVPDWFIAVGGRAGEPELLAAFRELVAAKAERKIVVVENFQVAKLLYPADAPRPTYGPKPAEPPPQTARSIFVSAFAGLDAPPFHAILMTRNFAGLSRKVFARTGAEVNLLEACGKRVAFNLAPETLDVMVPGLQLDAKRGPRRVWFGDVNTGKNVDFLPYSWPSRN